MNSLKSLVRGVASVIAPLVMYFTMTLIVNIYSLRHGNVFRPLGIVWCIVCLTFVFKQSQKDKENKRIEKISIYSVVSYLCAVIFMSILFGVNIVNVIRYISLDNPVITSIPSIPSVTTGFLLIPICEEIVYRGIVYNALCRVIKTNFILVNITQSFLFGLFTFNLTQGICYFFLGLFLGFVYERHRKLWLCTVLHLTFSLLVPILLINTYNVVILMIEVIVLIVLQMLYYLRGNLWKKSQKKKKENI